MIKDSVWTLYPLSNFCSFLPLLLFSSHGITFYVPGNQVYNTLNFCSTHYFCPYYLIQSETVFLFLLLIFAIWHSSFYYFFLSVSFSLSQYFISFQDYSLFITVNFLLHSTFLYVVFLPSLCNFSSFANFCAIINTFLLFLVVFERHKENYK